MADNQQFCLRWNNHQSTLVSVFDNLLEHGTLVDCTLAAEGQYLKAHKVVLCACSPYLELLLSQHYEKHPILILKDVKFQELKSMMDYMYKGEVNISQDQLGTFLKAAESLQIKGLTDGGGGENDSREVCSSQRRHDQQTRKTISSSSTRSNVLPSNSSGLTIEPSTSSGVRHNRSSIGQDRQPGSPIRSREDSLSPTPRKRRRQRRASQIDETFDSHHDSSNSSDLPSQGPSTPLSTIPSALSQLLPSGSSTISKAPDDPDQGIDDERLMAESGLIKEKMEPQSDLLEPKTEYIEEQNNDDSVEDLTLDDDDDMDGMEAGPSHGDGQGYGSWQMAGERATDEVFMAAQEAVGAHRDSQGSGLEIKSEQYLEMDQDEYWDTSETNSTFACVGEESLTEPRVDFNPQFTREHFNTVTSPDAKCCSICGDRSIGRLYGAYCCYGCKSFFRRTVRRKVVYPFLCEGKCKINKNTRNHCRHCRMAMCLKVGMKAEAVQIPMK